MYNDVVGVDSLGLGGGYLLFWNDNVKVKVITIVNVYVEGQNEGFYLSYVCMVIRRCNEEWKYGNNYYTSKTDCTNRINWLLVVILINANC